MEIRGRDEAMKCVPGQSPRLKFSLLPKCLLDVAESIASLWLHNTIRWVDCMTLPPSMRHLPNSYISLVSTSAILPLYCILYVAPETIYDPMNPLGVELPKSSE